MSKRFGRNSKRKLITKCKEDTDLWIARFRRLGSELAITVADLSEKLDIANEQIRILSRASFPQSCVEISGNSMDFENSITVHIDIPSYRVNIPRSIKIGSIDYTSSINQLIEQQTIAARISIESSIRKAVLNA